MKKQVLILITLFLTLISCNKGEEVLDPVISEPTVKLLFVANEGNYGEKNGSISVIDEEGVINTIENVGDVVQSLLVYNDKLFVIVNNSHMIKVFNIFKDGMLEIDSEISTNGSSPREMIVFQDKLYFTNWNTSDIKVLNLLNYTIESSIEVDGLPESIIENNGDLYVGITMNSDYSDASTVVKINPVANNITDSYEVGDGPTSLLVEDDVIYIARTFYDENWNAFHGTSSIDIKLDNTIRIADYGAGTVCGGSVHSYAQKTYRSFQGGIASIKEDLTIDESTLIGNYDANNVYSVETIGDRVYVGTYDGYVKILSQDNVEISNFKVGIFPGDFAIWKNN